MRQYYSNQKFLVNQSKVLMKKNQLFQTAVKRRSSSPSLSDKIYNSSKSKGRDSTKSKTRDIWEQQQFFNKQMTLNELFQQLCKQFCQSNTNRNCLIESEDSLQQLQDNIIGKIYLITGPSQCGKLSTVLYALRNKPKINILVINCNIYATQTQFITKLLEQIEKNSYQSNSKWNISLKINRQIINFDVLSQIVQKSNKKFVIFLRNSDQLTIYKQIILYNLIQWVNRQSIKHKVGLVFSSRKLSLQEKFQKRVKSRFCGRNIQISRISDPDKIVELILKRVQFLIQKRTSNKKNIAKKNKFICTDFKQQQISRKKTKKTEQKLKKLSIQDQVNYLQFIKTGISSNRKLLEQIKENLDDQILSISFVLRIFQQVFASIDPQKFIKWKTEDLQNYIFRQFKNRIQFQFPTFNIEANYLSNLNDTQVMILVMIVAMIKQRIYPIKLSQIYKRYQSLLHQSVHSFSMEGSSLKYPQQIIKRALLRLHSDRIIKFQKDNFDIWNTQINLLWERRKVQQGILNIKNLPFAFVQILKKGIISLT